MKKLKSSAILVALTLGVVVSALVIGASVAMSHFSKMSSQARDGRAAYRAALSGVEDGLLRYKYARAENSVASLVGDLGVVSLNNEDGMKMEYRLGFKTDSLSAGNATAVQSNDISAEDMEEINMDDTLDIDLTYFTSKATSVENRLTNLEIYFTSPYQSDPLQQIMLNDYFTALSARVLDISSTLSSEEQLVWEQTNVDPSLNKIIVGDLSKCFIANVSCHLRIRPQIASRQQLPNPLMSGRVTGAQNGTSKLIYYAIEATTDRLLESAKNSPGALIISSVGSVGSAKRKVEAMIDASSGNYLGLFDYGIYCGNECSGL